MTVTTVLVAFVFRLLGMYNFEGPSTMPDDSFFLAQFFLASSAPLLFARLLLLLQIDSTLGPMTHVSLLFVPFSDNGSVSLTMVRGLRALWSRHLEQSRDPKMRDQCLPRSRYFLTTGLS